MPKGSLKRKEELPTLELTGYSFDWDTKISNITQLVSDNDSNSEEEPEVPIKRKLTKRDKLEQERLNEQKLREAEEELLSLSNPKSVDQFDRLLLGSPNNSELWIKYMSFYVQSAEFEKVRAVAKRALKTINIKEEQDRFNVWVALLNFENLHGIEDSFSNCVQEAVRANDECKIYAIVMDMYVRSKKKQELDKLIDKVCKKFKESLECWLHCSKCYFLVKKPLKARFLLQRALTKLNKNEHISFISRFALLENQFGFSEEAQTLFEHILTSYPARTDIWSCYVDMLIKSNLISIARQILERARAQKLPPKKMRTLFTKSITFEEKYGNTETVKSIKSEAERYVKNYAKVLDN